MKLDRQNVIMEIISQQDIETQNQLLEALAKEALKVRRQHFPETSETCGSSRNWGQMVITAMSWLPVRTRRTRTQG